MTQIKRLCFTQFTALLLFGLLLTTQTHAETRGNTHTRDAASNKAFDFTLKASSDKQFSRPHDIVLNPDKKLLYVADNGNDRIVVLDAHTLQTKGAFGQAELREPHDVAFDPQGQLLVADTGNNRIAVFSIDAYTGTLSQSLRGRIRRPEGVAVSADGHIYATGAASANLVAFKDGKIVAEAKGLASAHDIELDTQGNIWVADTGNERLLKFNKHLILLQKIDDTALAFNGPRYMDFYSDDLMLVADKYSHNIKLVTTQGHLIQILGQSKPGLGEGVFDRPEGVEVAADISWFADTYNNRIVRYQMRPVKQ